MKKKPAKSDASIIAEFRSVAEIRRDINQVMQLLSILIDKFKENRPDQDPTIRNFVLKMTTLEKQIASLQQEMRSNRLHPLEKWIVQLANHIKRTSE